MFAYSKVVWNLMLTNGVDILQSIFSSLERIETNHFSNTLKSRKIS
jgi:hypothetical protein